MIILLYLKDPKPSEFWYIPYSGNAGFISLPVSLQNASAYFRFGRTLVFALRGQGTVKIGSEFVEFFSGLNSKTNAVNSERKHHEKPRKPHKSSILPPSPEHYRLNHKIEKGPLLDPIVRHLTNELNAPRFTEGFGDFGCFGVLGFRDA